MQVWKVRPRLFRFTMGMLYSGTAAQVKNTCARGGLVDIIPIVDARDGNGKATIGSSLHQIGISSY
jgi:hypothetical protein